MSEAKSKKFRNPAISKYFAAPLIEILVEYEDQMGDTAVKVEIANFSIELGRQIKADKLLKSPVKTMEQLRAEKDKLRSDMLKLKIQTILR